ncbi:hypothetical protein LTR17_015153 [Elasticomyces elasticus]|nr:hypothetical protein LTR17_015153 [Elasticomyces elasticus]
MASSTGNYPRLPEDYLGRKFICHTPCWDSKGKLLLAKGDGGEIRGTALEKKLFRVRVQSRPDSTSSDPKIDIPMDNVTVGAKTVVGGLKVHTEFETVNSLNRPLPGHSYNRSDDFRKHLVAYLNGLAEAQMKLPGVRRRVKAWFQQKGKSLDESIKITADKMQSAIIAVSPKLPGVMCQNDFTIEDIIKVCPVVTSTDRTAGIYLRVYSDFKGVDYRHDAPHIYVGQSVNMGDRTRVHTRDTKVNLTSGHYKVARAASKTRVVKLAKLDSASSESMKGLLDLLEQTFISGLMSYFKKVHTWSKMKSTSGNVAQAEVDEEFEERNLAKVHVDLAKVAFAKSGFALPGMPGRSKSFGVVDGCNFMSVLGELTAIAGKDPMLWAMYDLGDRWVFYRSGKTINQEGHVFQKIYHDGQGDRHIFGIQLSKEYQADARCPSRKDVVYAAWELMKPGKGPHETPYFRLPEIGPYDNWSTGNKLGFKFIWHSAKYNQWFVKTIQQMSKNYLWQVGPGPAQHEQYKLSTGLYAYFMRSQWPDKPTWVADFGRASVLRIEVNQLQQRIDATVISGSLAVLEGPKFSVAAATNMMKAETFRGDMFKGEAMFEAVGSSKFNKALRWDWFTNPCKELRAALNDHKGQRGKNTYGGSHQRTACDMCMIGTYLHSRRIDNCERDGTSNACKFCTLRGLECSWTPIYKLAGYRWSEMAKGHRAKDNMNDKEMMDFHPPFRRYCNLLFDLPADEKAQEITAISNPGFHAFDPPK